MVYFYGRRVHGRLNQIPQYRPPGAQSCGIVEIKKYKVANYLTEMND